MYMYLNIRSALILKSFSLFSLDVSDFKYLALIQMFLSCVSMRVLLQSFLFLLFNKSDLNQVSFI